MKCDRVNHYWTIVNLVKHIQADLILILMAIVAIVACQSSL